MSGSAAPEEMSIRTPRAGGDPVEANPAAAIAPDAADAAMEQAAAAQAGQAAPGRGWRVIERFRQWEVEHDRFEFRRAPDNSWFLGKGSYGKVAAALDHSHDPPRRVAIKKIYSVFGVFENAKRIHRELCLLRQLHQRNIIRLVHICQPADLAGFQDLYVVFEQTDTDMYKLLHDYSQQLEVAHVKFFLNQLLLSLKYLQSAQVLHRDIKPANVLLYENCDLALCDFGLARPLAEAAAPEDAPAGRAPGIDELVDGADVDMDGGGAAAAGGAAAGGHGDRPPLSRELTRHVVTRYYRAPEIITGAPYGFPSDIWAAGCSIAELFDMVGVDAHGRPHRRRVLFRGEATAMSPQGRSGNSAGQLQIIANGIGRPSDEDMSKYPEEAAAILRALREPTHRLTLERRFPNATEQGIDLLRRMLAWVPEERITVDEALAHPFLAGSRTPDQEVCAPGPALVPKATKANVRQLIVDEIRHFNPGM